MHGSRWLCSDTPNFFELWHLGTFQKIQWLQNFIRHCSSSSRQHRSKVTNDINTHTPDIVELDEYRNFSHELSVYLKLT